MAAPNLNQDGINNRVEFSDGIVGYADSSGVVYTKIGWRTVYELGRKLCAIQTSFQPLVRRLFSDVPTIIILLDILNVLCLHVVPNAKHMADGGMVSDMPSTSEDVLTALQSIIDNYTGGA